MGSAVCDDTFPNTRRNQNENFNYKKKYKQTKNNWGRFSLIALRSGFRVRFEPNPNWWGIGFHASRGYDCIHRGRVPPKKTTNQSGAARKRYKWLLKQGHKPKDAQKLAKNTMPKAGNAENKRGHSEDSTPPQHIGKKYEGPQVPEACGSASSPRVSYGMVAGNVRLALISQDHPMRTSKSCSRR